MHAGRSLAGPCRCAIVRDDPEGTVATQQGYFLIADISGYTRFLSGTELEHAQGIIEDICGVVHRALVPALRFVKLEGDALFCYAPATQLTDGERLIELVEACHFDFSQRIEEMQRRTTCECRACASIGSLGLKFVAHYGDYVVQSLAGTEDIAGPDVIAVHRLLKNSVIDSTGWTAYFLATKACADQTGVVTGWTTHEEDIEPLGRTACGVRDLLPGTEARRAAKRIFVEPGEADFSVTWQFDATPSQVWQYWMDDDKTLRWQVDVRSMTYDKNAEGRMGNGAVGHCDHGSWASDTRYLDWRPFSYCTLERVSTKGSLTAAPPMLETMELAALADGRTELRYRMQARTRAGRLKLKLFGPMVRRSFEKELLLLERVLREDGITTVGTAQSPPPVPSVSPK